MLGALCRAERAGRGPRGDHPQTRPSRRHGNVRSLFAQRRAFRRWTSGRRLQHQRTPQMGVRRKASPCPQSSQSRPLGPRRENAHRPELTSTVNPRQGPLPLSVRGARRRFRPIRSIRRLRRPPGNDAGGLAGARTVDARPSRAIRSAVMPGLAWTPTMKPARSSVTLSVTPSVTSVVSRSSPTRHTRGRSALGAMRSMPWPTC